MQKNKFLLFSAASLIMVFGLSMTIIMGNAQATNYPWLSWRHDLNNTAAAPDTGYPTTATVLWDKTRGEEAPPGNPARCSTPVTVGDDIVMSTGHGGRVEARDQYTGDLIWTKLYTWGPMPPNPPDAPTDWCQGSTPHLTTNLGICGYKINGECPDWCYECSDTPNDCKTANPQPLGLSLVDPLHFPPEYGTFVAAPTIDIEPTCGGINATVYYGTMDGRFFAINLENGNQLWMKEPWKEPGGPNEGRAWYDQKFAWHLSPPAVYNGKLYFDSFLPSFYWVFKAMPFILDDQGHSIPGWPSFEKDYKQYWVGRDGWTYCADKNTGDILWGWDPGG